MEFTKMHGCGNDYIIINDCEHKIDNPSELAIRMCNRHYGIGADGLIIISQSRRSLYKMKMINTDGSIGRMCGNGIRCMAKYLYDNHLINKTQYLIETDAGIKKIMYNMELGELKTITVNMGSPDFRVGAVNVNYEKKIIFQENIEFETGTHNVSCVSMGNPHTVIICSDKEEFNKCDISVYGKKICNSDIFTEGTNVEVVYIKDTDNIIAKIWERGCGETLSCGTGACAAAVVCYHSGKCNNKVNVELAGGTLEVEYDTVRKLVYLTGEAVTVFKGCF